MINKFIKKKIRIIYWLNAVLCEYLQQSKINKNNLVINFNPKLIKAMAYINLNAGP